VSRLLIVNADDYGLTEAVSTGILRAHRQGLVTSTSVLAVAPGFAPTGAWLCDEAELGVGVHLAVVGEDPPLLSASEVPTLVDRRGRFALSWRVFLRRSLAGRVDPDDVRREFASQIDAVAALGISITHLDSHQHLHIWPSIRPIVVKLAAAKGIRALRVPRSHRRSPVSVVVNRLSGQLASAAAVAGLRFPADASGIDEAGHLDTPLLLGALDGFLARDAASAELGAHPGERLDPDRHRYRWGYSWEQELEILVDPGSRDAVERRGFVLGNYSQLARSGPAAS
jgi:predicted glycoside hydrolase/deacetylase ChbG (UPF0249 family)